MGTLTYSKKRWAVPADDEYAVLMAGWVVTSGGRGIGRVVHAFSMLPWVYPKVVPGLFVPTRASGFCRDVQPVSVSSGHTASSISKSRFLEFVFNS
jgi:hypothetical protein